MSNDSDHICITCGKANGTCRWVDDAEGCMRKQLTDLRTRAEALEQALRTCDEALERIDAEAQRCRKIQGGPAIPETNAAKSYGYGKIVVVAREARRAAKEAIG